MQRARATLFAATLLLAMIGFAAAQSDDDSQAAPVNAPSMFSRWEISLGGQVGAPRGFVKVGEFDRSGDKLRFRKDLGIDSFEVVDVGVGVHLTDRDVLRARVDYTFLWGEKQLDHDLAFNGATLAGDTHLQSHPVFTRITGLYEHAFISEPNGALLAGGAGLTYVYLHFKLHGTLAPSTIGHETQEDFYAQELPVPVLSLRGEYPIGPRVHLIGAVDGGFLPKIDSLRSEGGTVKLAQGHADVFAGVRYVVTPQLSADGGFTYTYFSQHETSSEDNNKILFLGYAFGFRLAYAF